MELKLEFPVEQCGGLYGIPRNSILNALKDSARMKDIARGRAIHAAVCKVTSDLDMVVSSSLLNMYCKCGSIWDARQVFEEMSQHDVVSWTTLISGYADNGQGKVALGLFGEMQREGCQPNALTFVAVTKACISLRVEEEDKCGALENGMAIHCAAVDRICCLDIYLVSTLVTMYAKSGLMLYARKVFDQGIQAHNVVSWNSLILGYADNGQGLSALELFAAMDKEDCDLNSFTFVAVLKACTCLAAKKHDVAGRTPLETGMAIHCKCFQKDCDGMSYVIGTLVDMYVKCGALVHARQVFESTQYYNLISWTAIISGYAENGDADTALYLFCRMDAESCQPDYLAIVAVLKICAKYGELEATKLVKTRWLDKGLAIHLLASDHSYSAHIYVSNALIDMYSKCGKVDFAQRVFETIPRPNIVCWNSLIFGHAENGEASVALKMFYQMKQQGFQPDSLTFVAALKACSLLGDLETGKSLHSDIRVRGFESEMMVAASLIDFYCKCRSMVHAQRIFDSLSARNLVIYTALLSGYGLQGDAVKVFQLFERMQDEKVQPNEITFLCLLTACSHAGSVDQGTEYFEAMSSKYQIPPALEHYTCMVDMLGRANRLEDAVKLINSMPFKPDAVSWMTLLSSCFRWRNAELGKLAFDRLMVFDDKNQAAYVLMAHLQEERKPGNAEVVDN